MKIYRGTVVTCDKENRVCQYLVENRGHIAYVGNNLPGKFQGQAVRELGRKALLPSFADTHIHFASYSLFASTLDLRQAGSFSDLGALINYYAHQHKKERIILAFGISAHSLEEQRLIEREELDALFSQKPLMIIKYDGHASIINTKMMEIIPDTISALPGFHGGRGHLNQQAFFAATDFITAKISPLTLVKNMIHGVDLMAAQGIGMMHTTEGVGFPHDLDVDLVRFFAKGQRNRFQFRLFFQTMDASKVIKRKLPRIGGCFATALDGSFGSEDAALLAPYANNRNNSGVLFYSDERVMGFTKTANRAGLQIEMHAIGDAAFNQAILALEKALEDFPRTDHRHTIIHACLPTAEGLEKCAQLGIGIAAQPAFLHWTLEPLTYLEEILGRRAYAISPYKDMLDLGLHVSGGSDAPCTLPDPVAAIHAVCNHYVSEQSLSIRQALRMFTYEAAWMSFDEKERGSLEAGKIADLVILNQNPLAMKRKNLLDLKVEELLLAGKPYQATQGLGSLAARGLWGRRTKI